MTFNKTINSIAFVDTEIEPNSRRILDIGSIKSDGNSFHKPSVSEFIHFLKGTEYVCGHNIFNHDILYIGKAINDAGIKSSNLIDTLFLSPLLFPSHPYHALVKNDKLHTDDLSNPLNDSIKAQDLFYEEIAAFRCLDEEFRNILFLLLNTHNKFQAFFSFISFEIPDADLELLILKRFVNKICNNVDLVKIINDYPMELAYCLALINADSRYSITPPWVIKSFPAVEKVMFFLRNKPCLTGCNYCNQSLDARKGLKKYFHFDSYRTYNGESLQENAVKAAIDNKSILAVFPTGGGKSITFQVPALICGENTKGLTVVISPLQSLMKDQVDNLYKAGITEAVTINGLLDPIERSESFKRVEEGSAYLLYISPESLRSKTIEHLILNRKISRFVIDEAHCFSSWGQDFRVDYLYIGDFIKSIQDQKHLEIPIPVSCFTATAKQKVIEDIKKYFNDKLSIDLEIFSAKESRTNLKYIVIPKNKDEDKYKALRDLIEQKECPTIVYVSRTYKASLLADKLIKDGFNAKAYHGKMEVKDKTENQNSFISGHTQIMVATSAFGMGVDKKDVGMVIHYDISDSLENYVQESGRAGRDTNVTADCYVLYDEEDLNKHFVLLNQTKLSIKEIQQVWKAIKDITKFRSTTSNSALEIARKAGWDDDVNNIETRVTTAIAALENAGYLKRGQNIPRIYANSILSKNAQEAISKINTSSRFTEKQKENGIRIITKLFSSKNRKKSNDESAESRIDYISDHLGIVKEEVIRIIYLLREENILADTKDLTAFIKKGENKNRSLKIVESFSKIEKFILPLFDDQKRIFNIKEINEQAEESGCESVTPNKIKTILNFWVIKNWIKRESSENSKSHYKIMISQPKNILIEKLENRYELAKFIVEYLFNKSFENSDGVDYEEEEVLIEFSVQELKSVFEKKQNLIDFTVSNNDIEDALFYLSRIEAIKIEGGFLVVYNRLTIERTEHDNKKRYKVEDYQKLNQFYENKVQQIHIVGEYAKRMISDYKEALQFVDDYFQLNYSSFLNKYFKGSRLEEIKQNITPAKFKELFGVLSPAQLKIIKDNEANFIVVAAGPGSGKTRVLVHKLASLLLMEDVKHEQLLMLTFSRAAATEFKKRLLKLIGNAANFIDIKTFHSYCFDLLGKVGNLDKSDAILKKTVEMINNGHVEPNKITKTVLVIDEAQDMNAEEFALVNALIARNDDIRVIAVGDDDQNIYDFRGSSSKYLEQFINENSAVKYELIENYRSKNNLVFFTNQFLENINHRLKQTPIVAKQSDNGKIKIIRYSSKNLITPLISEISHAELSGMTCVLTITNEEALQITGLLLKKGIPAKLIQSNDNFNLFNLLEIRYFWNRLDLEEDKRIIDDEIWENAKSELKNKFQRSTRYEVCNNLIKDFESVFPYKKYKSDFKNFIRESKIEDFLTISSELIFVSTIHKAKGKEFDNVYIMLDNFDISNDEAKRQLYVAMTRAKQNLNIHLNSHCLGNITVDNLVRIEDREIYLPPAEMSLHLNYKEVWLDFFINKQQLISQLTSGDMLTLNEYECLNSQGQSVLKFSNQFIEKIELLKEKNYELLSARVNLIVYWSKENTEQEVKIILPELFFKKKQG